MKESNAVLSKSEILEAIHGNKPLVHNYIDLDLQLQSAGFELTMSELHRFTSSGTLGFSNEHRILASTEPVEFMNSTFHNVAPGSYLVRYNEVVALPHDIMALILPRSSLMRNGAILYTAVWDPGYEGRGQGLLNVYNPHGIILQKNARIAQMIFIKVRGSPRDSYAGRYQKEGL